MTERTRDVVTVVAIVAVMLAVFWGALFLRRPAPGGEPPAGGAPEAGPAPATARTPAVRPSVAAVPEVPTEPAVGSVKPSPEPADARTERRIPASASGASPGPGSWTKRPPGEFTPEELSQCGRGVRVGLGVYEVKVGDEFDVSVALTGPALESCTLMVQFDPGALALVPGSAVPLSPQFRGGIECYGNSSRGTVVLIHAGTPGQKNVDASPKGASVGWRMKGLRPGDTRLVVLPESSFTNGRGDEEAYESTGGEVSVR